MTRRPSRYKIPVTGSVGSYRATVTKLFKKDGLLHVTVGYIPNQNATDSILTTTSDTPVKYMDYLFSRQSGSWYLTGLTESETKPEAQQAPLPRSRSLWQKAMCRTPFWQLPETLLRQIRLLPRLSSRKRRQKRALTAPWQKPPPLRMPPVPQRKM